jgi:hypothetical protein
MSSAANAPANAPTIRKAMSHAGESGGSGCAATGMAVSPFAGTRGRSARTITSIPSRVLYRLGHQLLASPVSTMTVVCPR